MHEQQTLFLKSVMYAELTGNCKKQRIKSLCGNKLDITHSIDGLRYYAISRQMVAEKIKEAKIKDPFFDEPEPEEDGYYLTGAEPDEKYMNF